MPELNYTIKTGAELAGAQAAADALERQIGKARALGQDFSELQRQHDLVTESIKNAKVPQEDNNEAMRQGGVSARGLHGALHLIAAESGPAMGAAVGAAAALMTGGLLTVVFAVRELFNWFKELQQKAEEFRERQAALWLAAEEGARQAATAAQEFNDKLDDEAEKTESLKTKFGDEIKLLHTQLAAHKLILEAIEKEELAAAAGDKDKEAAIKSRFDRLKNQYDLEGERQRIALEQRQLGELQLAKWGDDLAAKGLEKIKENLVAQAPQLKAALDNVTEEFGDPKKIKATFDQATALLQKGLSTGSMKELPGGGLEITDLAKFVNGGGSEYDLLKMGGAGGIRKAQENWAKYQEAKGAVDANDAGLREVDRGLGKAESASATDGGSISTLTASIAELTAELRVHSTTAAQKSVLDTKGGKAGEALGQLADETGMSYSQIVGQVTRILNHQMTVQQAFSALEQRQAILEERQKQLNGRIQANQTQ